jgi:hypothetical protein
VENIQAPKDFDKNWSICSLKKDLYVCEQKLNAERAMNSALYKRLIEQACITAELRLRLEKVGEEDI